MSDDLRFPLDAGIATYGRTEHVAVPVPARAAFGIGGSFLDDLRGHLGGLASASLGTAQLLGLASDGWWVLSPGRAALVLDRLSSAGFVAQTRTVYQEVDRRSLAVAMRSVVVMFDTDTSETVIGDLCARLGVDRTGEHRFSLVPRMRSFAVPRPTGATNDDDLFTLADRFQASGVVEKAQPEILEPSAIPVATTIQAGGCRPSSAGGGDCDDWQWAYVDRADAWRRGRGDRATAAVIDHEIDFEHDKLAHAAPWSGGYELDLVSGRVSFACGLSGETLAFNCHGTEVAGILGARATRTDGREGMAPDATLVCIDLKRSGFSISAQSVIARALCFAADPTSEGNVMCLRRDPADVVNLSIDRFGALQFPLARILSALPGRGTSVVIALADRLDWDVTHWAMGSRPDLAMGVTQVNAAGALATPTPTGRGIFCAAPGRDVGLPTKTNSAAMCKSSGTSYAAPLVAGALTLMVSRARDRGLRLTSAGVRRLLSGSIAVDQTLGADYGQGLLDAGLALDAIDEF